MIIQAWAELALLTVMEVLLETEVVELAREAWVLGVPVAVLEHVVPERLGLMPRRPPPAWSDLSKDWINQAMSVAQDGLGSIERRF